jgi:cardiolipin synthase
MPRKTPINSAAFSIHNLVQLIKGGADYFDRLETLIDGAHHWLHLQTYIFDADETGSKVAAALVRAAQRKVAVYLLVDGYASGSLPEHFIKSLKDAGVHFAFFNPVFRSGPFYLGRRLHHKVAVADGAVCMVAGLNISNRYNDIGAIKAWLDWAFYAEGEVARQLHMVCASLWNRSPKREICILTVKNLTPLPPEICNIRIRRNDWLYRKTEITRSFRDLFRHSQKQVTVMTGYFWPPQRLLLQMDKAAKRGVKIKLILTSRADVPLSKYTERYLYGRLLRNNIEIYEYQKNILHGKIAVRDDAWITGGSYNMNNISAFASVELNLEVNNAETAREVNNQLQMIIDNDCLKINKEEYYAGNNTLRRFFYFLSYKATHIIFFLFTFYFRQKKWNE